MNQEFLTAIENPSNPTLAPLLQEAMEDVQKQLSEQHIEDLSEKTLKRFSYTYYHDWENDDPEYVFLLEDPGMPGEHVVTELNEIDKAAEEVPTLDLVNVMRNFGARWLMQRRYTDFTHLFLTTCENAGLIELEDPWWKYLLSQKFFNDFYMADVLKYRDAKDNDAIIRTAYTEYLYDELEYVDPDIIFTFGKRAWETLRDNLEIELVESGVDDSKINSVHGQPGYPSISKDWPVIPLGHMSPNFLGAQISHEEYFRRLERGIKTVKRSN